MGLIADVMHSYTWIILSYPPPFFQNIPLEFVIFTAFFAKLGFL